MVYFIIRSYVLKTKKHKHETTPFPPPFPLLMRGTVHGQRWAKDNARRTDQCRRARLPRLGG